jgi:hypothetical protein
MPQKFQMLTEVQRLAPLLKPVYNFFALQVVDFVYEPAKLLVYLVEEGK